MQRIGSCKGDGAFGDEGDAHDVVDDARLALLLGPTVLEERGGEGGDDRGNHAADHDGSHDLLADLVAAGEGCGAEDIRGLVDGAAHVDGHHAAEDEAEDDLVTGAEAVEPGGDTSVDGTDDGVDEEHQETHDEDAAEREEKHGLDALERVGQLVEQLAETEDDVAACEAGDEGAEEAGRNRGDGRVHDAREGHAARRERAADEADGEAGTVSDRVGDVAGEDREHEAEGDAADVLEERGDDGRGAERAGASGRAVEQEGDGDKDAAADDERQHVADAAHQVLVDGVTGGVLLARRGSRGGLLAGVVDGGLAARDLLDEGLRLADALGDVGHVDALALEAAHVDVLVGGDDDAVGLGDLLGGQHVLGADGTLRLHLDGDAELLALLRKPLRRHVGMCDTGGTCGDAKNPVRLFTIGHVGLLLLWAEFPVFGRAFLSTAEAYFPGDEPRVSSFLLDGDHDDVLEPLDARIVRLLADDGRVVEIGELDRGDLLELGRVA